MWVEKSILGRNIIVVICHTEDIDEVLKISNKLGIHDDSIEKYFVQFGLIENDELEYFSLMIEEYNRRRSILDMRHEDYRGVSTVITDKFKDPLEFGEWIKQEFYGVKDEFDNILDRL